MEQQRAYRTFQFENVVVWKSEFRGILSASEHPTVEIGNPPVFKGTPDVWCPEDLIDWHIECSCCVRHIAVESNSSNVSGR